MRKTFTNLTNVLCHAEPLEASVVCTTNTPHKKNHKDAYPDTLGNHFHLYNMVVILSEAKNLQLSTKIPSTKIQFRFH